MILKLKNTHTFKKNQFPFPFFTDIYSASYPNFLQESPAFLIIQTAEIKEREREREIEQDLNVLREVFMLHGEVHSSLEALVPCIDYLPRKAIQGFLDVQIIIGIKKIVISKTFTFIKMSKQKKCKLKPSET